MGRIKELRDKVAKQEATPEEEQELAELESEANEDQPRKPNEGEETTTGEGDEDEDEEVAVDKLAAAIVGKVNKRLESVVSAIDKAEQRTPSVQVNSTPFILDKSLGKVAVPELDNIKVVLPGRKAAGKSVTEVTGKTVHFLNALLTGDREKLQLLTEGTAGRGGYLVPEEFANMIVEDLRDATIMRQLAESVTIQSDTFHLPTLDSRPKAQWRSEGAVKSTSTAQFSELVFTPYSLAAIVGLSNELDADATLGVNGSIINYIGRLMTQSIAETEDKAFWAGSGSGQPTGVTTYTIGSIAAGGTDATRADAVTRLYHRLPQGYRNRAAWVGSSAAWEKVAVLKDANNQYLLRGLADSPTPVLKGRPVFEQNDLPHSELYFGDFSYYMIVDREGVSVDVSREATVASQSAFERNLTFVRAEKRVDGELTHTNAIRKITGF